MGTQILMPALSPTMTEGKLADRTSVVQGKSVDLGGRRIIKKKNTEPTVLAKECCT